MTCSASRRTTELLLIAAAHALAPSTNLEKRLAYSPRPDDLGDYLIHASLALTTRVGEFLGIKTQTGEFLSAPSG